LETLQLEVRSLEAGKVQHGLESTQLRSELTHLQSENARLQLELTAKDIASKELDEKRNGLQKELKTVREEHVMELQEAMELIDAFQSELTAKDDAVTQLEKDNDLLKELNAELRSCVELQLKEVDDELAELASDGEDDSNGGGTKSGEEFSDE
jgi:predicted RNase H-like nuclease (RuvC/YqgF family)